MDRRQFIKNTSLLLTSSLLPGYSLAKEEVDTIKLEKIEHSEAIWRRLLTAEQYHILRDEGTEQPFSSSLNNEKRKGTYTCVACELPLFTSDMKYDSGTGWPSFYDVIKGSVETELDFKLIYPRTEYHCVRCGGHQGHIFKDGPKPTGKRWCNNGIALKFIPHNAQQYSDRDT